MIQRNIKRPSSSYAEFLGNLFGVRDQIHLIHLSTRSYSEHKALDEFYTALLDLIDGLAEGIQGVHGLQEITIPTSTQPTSSVEILTEFYNMLEEKRILYSEGWVQNQIDEIAQLTAQTLYKLKFLK